MDLVDLIQTVCFFGGASLAAGGYLLGRSGQKPAPGGAPRASAPPTETQRQQSGRELELLQSGVLGLERELESLRRKNHDLEEKLAAFSELDSRTERAKKPVDLSMSMTGGPATESALMSDLEWARRRIGELEEELRAKTEFSSKIDFDASGSFGASHLTQREIDGRPPPRKGFLLEDALSKMEGELASLRKENARLAEDKAAFEELSRQTSRSKNNASRDVSEMQTALGRLEKELEAKSRKLQAKEEELAAFAELARKKKPGGQSGGETRGDTP